MRFYKIDGKKYLFSSNFKHFNYLYGVSNDDKRDIDNKIENTLAFYKDSYIEVDGINKISLFDISRSANIAPTKYYGETYNRVNALREYAKDIGFDTPVFITLTAPSRYKPLKQIKLKKYIKLVDNPNFTGETDYIRLARDYISKKWCSFLQTQIFKDIKSAYGNRAIFLRTYEPHLDGTPHSHIVIFIPSEYKERFLKLAKNYFKTKTDVKSEFNGDLGGVIAYILKYVLKSFKNGKNGKLCDVAYWYAKNGVRRFSTSRTLIPMYIYRKIIKDSRFRDLKKVTNLFKDGFISCDLLADVDKSIKCDKLLAKDYKIATIIISIEGFNYLEHHIAYQRNYNITLNLSDSKNQSKTQSEFSKELYFNAFKNASKDGKFISKSSKYQKYLYEKDKILSLSAYEKPINLLTDYELVDVYNSIKKCNYTLEENVIKFAYLENELCRRGLVGMTTFKQPLKLTSKEDLILQYANENLCDLPF